MQHFQKIKQNQANSGNYLVLGDKKATFIINNNN